MGLTLIVMISLPWVSSEAEVSADPLPQPKQEFKLSEIQRKVRAFRVIGDQFLTGEPEAYKKRQALSLVLSEELLSQPLETWKRVQDAEALMSFVLFGGRAEALDKALASGNLPEPLKDVAYGLSAYAGRRLDLARTHFENVDFLNMSDALRAPLKLVQGTLLAETKPDEALALFESVRLLQPGTALEEAAMRQQALVLIKKENIKEAVALIGSYTRRYPKSVYWQQFHTVAAEALSELPFSDVEALARELDNVPGETGANRFRDFLVETNRHLLEKGEFERAKRLADAILQASQIGSQAWHRAKLYSLVSRALFDDPSEVREEILMLDRKQYSDDERALIEASLGVTDKIIEGYKVDLSAASPANPTDLPLEKWEHAVGSKESPGTVPDTATIALPTDLKDDIEKTLAKATERLAGGGS
jgi:chemotaxis protein MotC